VHAALEGWQFYRRAKPLNDGLVGRKVPFLCLVLVAPPPERNEILRGATVDDVARQLGRLTLKAYWLHKGLTSRTEPFMLIRPTLIT